MVKLEELLSYFVGKNDVDLLCAFLGYIYDQNSTIDAL